MTVLQNFQADQFFTEQQQARLSELMNLYQTARDQGNQLSNEQQVELESLVDNELKAATLRTTAMFPRGTATSGNSQKF